MRIAKGFPQNPHECYASFVQSVQIKINANGKNKISNTKNNVINQHPAFLFTLVKVVFFHEGQLTVIGTYQFFGICSFYFTLIKFCIVF